MRVLRVCVEAWSSRADDVLREGLACCVRWGDVLDVRHRSEGNNETSFSLDRSVVITSHSFHPAVSGDVSCAGISFTPHVVVITLLGPLQCNTNEFHTRLPNSFRRFSEHFEMVIPEK